MGDEKGRESREKREWDMKEEKGEEERRRKM